MAFGYGVNAFACTGPQLAAYQLHLPRLRAQERLAESDLTGMHWRDVKRLYLEAYEDTRLADKAVADFLEAQQREATQAAMMRERERG